MMHWFHRLSAALVLGLVATFWLSTLVAEIFLSSASVVQVKQLIVQGIFILVPCMIFAGVSGRQLARQRSGPLITTKQRRMPILALNGLLILLPCAFYLEHKAVAGQWDWSFYGVQGLEFVAGGLQLVLLMGNAKAGRRLRAMPALAH